MGQAIGIAVIAAMGVPWLTISAMMIFVGLRSMNDPKNPDDLIECFLAGVLFVLLYLALVYYLYWRLPRLAIQNFELTDNEFRCETRGDGVQTFSLEPLPKVELSEGRRRQFYGWWIRFPGSRWLLLTPACSNAMELIRVFDPKKV